MTAGATVRRRTSTARRATAALCALMLLIPAAAAGSARGLPPVRHVFVMVFENKAYDETFGFLSQAPYLSRMLPTLGALVPNFYGVTHESMGNYVALVSGQGSNPQTQSDCQVYSPLVPGTIGANGQAIGNGCVYPAAVQTIANQLQARGRTWKGYMEDMGNAKGQPKTCRHPALGSMDNTQKARAGDQYAARHNPFVYFDSLLGSGACARYDVPLTQLPTDLASAAATPSYSFIVPNLCNDGHDLKCVDGRTGGLAATDRFLRLWVPRITNSPAYKRGGLLVIMFDEAEEALDWAQSRPAGVPPGGDASACCNEPQFPNTPNNGGPNQGPGGGRVGAVVLSPYIDPGTIDEVSYNHFSLLRSVEDLFGLSHLGFAAQAGLRPFGADLFTCYRGVTPRARHGRLARGSEIKVAMVGEQARGASIEAKLWHAGVLSVQVRLRGSRRTRLLARVRSPGSCQLIKIPLPPRHGVAILSARALGGVERRTLSF